MQVLHAFPFDSTRKRMSVVVRHPRTQQVILYCKGADNAILAQASSGAPRHSPTRSSRPLNEHLTVFSVHCSPFI